MNCSNNMRKKYTGDLNLRSICRSNNVDLIGPKVFLISGLFSGCGVPQPLYRGFGPVFFFWSDWFILLVPLGGVAGCSCCSRLFLAQASFRIKCF